MKSLVSLLCLIVFIKFSNSFDIRNFKDDNNDYCNFIGSNGNKYNLEGIGYLTYKLPNSPTDRGYGLNLCKALEGNDQLCGDKDNAAICVTDNFSEPEEWQPYVLGFLPPSKREKFVDIDLSLSYTGQKCFLGLQQFIVNSIVDAKCGNINQVTSISSSSYGICAQTFNISIESPIFCSKRLSGGEIFLIIFFVSIGVYFFAGMAIQYHRKRSGKEIDSIIPNITFWKAFGSLVKDGALFLKSKITGKTNQSYQTIDS